jgi:hypothetical protein
MAMARRDGESARVAPDTSRADPKSTTDAIAQRLGWGSRENLAGPYGSRGAAAQVPGRR